MGRNDDLNKMRPPMPIAGSPFLNDIPEDGSLGKAQLLRDNRTNRVVYMSVGKDFANALLTFLSLPASIISDIFAEATYLRPVGCIANIFESLRDANQASASDGEAQNTCPGPEHSLSKSSDSPLDKKRKVGRKRKAPVKKPVSKQSTEQAEANLLRAAEEEHAWHLHIYKHLIMHRNVEMRKNSKKRYKCRNTAFQQNCAIMVTESKGMRCMQCKEEMTVEVIPNNGLETIDDAPYVVFSEKLAITPLVTVNSFVEVMMKKKDVESLAHLDMCDVSVGIKEVLLLAHASLTSSHPLTRVFSPEYPQSSVDS